MSRDHAQVSCAICGRACKLIGIVPRIPGTGGWYCEKCDAFTETDIEIED